MLGMGNETATYNRLEGVRTLGDELLVTRTFGDTKVLVTRTYGA